jgi:hypothetical protein
MHKYFNFAKIFEAEQAGEPLAPEEMGTPSAPEKAANSSSEASVVNLEELAKTHELNVLFTKHDIEQLERDGTLLKPGAQFQDESLANIVEIPIKISVAGRQSTGSQDDANAISFVIGEDDFKSMKDAMVGGTYQSELVSGDTSTPVKVKFNLDQSLYSQKVGQQGVAPSDAQVKAGSVPPPPVEGSTAEAGSNESRSIMSFSQFVNEEKKNKWIADVVKDMDKGALRKEMKLKKGEEMNLSDIAKSEAKLKKKDKDKKKPGLQLDAKDAKTHKRNTLAKNLIKASRGK